MTKYLWTWCVAFVMVAGCAARADTPMAMDLWPGTAPGEDGTSAAEKDIYDPATDKPIAGRPIIKLANVSKPTLSIYLAPAERNTGTMVLVVPGGGYWILAMDLEGTEVAQWLNSIGVNAAVLKYRVPSQYNTPRAMAPQQDAQRAMRLLRAHAEQWRVDPARVGIMGFSAGGHLALMTCLNSKQEIYPPVDAADKESSRPNFAVLAYAGGVMNKEGKPNVSVDAGAPPMFLVHASDDRSVRNSIALAEMLRVAQVPVELHLYSAGGHGFGMRRTEQPCTTWGDRLQEWMKAMKLLEHRGAPKYQ